MSTTIDLRPVAWHELREGLEGHRLDVFNALALRPATCSELAERMGWPVTSVRPRVTELRKMGLVDATGARRESQHEFEVVRREPRQLDLF
jgi:predicted transcriptional regulator